MHYEFIGRVKELDNLKWYLKKDTASLIVIKGRRRIGKTTLVEKFAQGKKFFRFSGLPPSTGVTTEDQKNHFKHEFRQYFKIGLESNDWSELFIALAQLIPAERTILFFDEISWLVGSDYTFLPKFKDAWDKYFSKKSKLIFILCGSISSWIEDNILSNTGFVGRINYTLTLKELPLKECKLFWGRYASQVSSYEILKILSVTGGIPLYLDNIDPQETAEKNIKRLCFTPGGLLVDEFDRIFTEVFLPRTSLYKDILIKLANGSKQAQALAKELNYELSGRFSIYIRHLELAGFIKRDYAWTLGSDTRSNLSTLRISDNYVRFFLKYIYPDYDQIEQNEARFSTLSNLSNWSSIIGLQFENLVLNNRSIILEELGAEFVDIIHENPYFQRKTNRHPGCQIDYLVQTRYNTLYVCEIKFSTEPIGMSVIKEVEEKIRALHVPKNFSYRPVLIHVNGVTEHLEGEKYFYKIIDFGKFLEG